MSLWTMIFLIVLVGCVTNVLTERYRAMDRVAKRKAAAIDDATGGERLAQSQELQELRERIKVLERIATDGNTLAARETREIAAEIEALRGSDALRGRQNG